MKVLHILWYSQSKFCTIILLALIRMPQSFWWGGGAKGKVWQKTISRLSGRELVIPKSTELVAYGAAAQAAGILNNEAAVDVAARWNVSDGPRLAASAVDSEAIERNQCIREAAHELNSREFFIIPQSRT